MTKLLAVLTPAALCLALIAAPSAGAQKRSISFDGVVVKTNLVEGTTFAGLIRGGPLGRGAVTNTAKSLGDNRFSSVGTVFYRRGTLAVTFTNTSVPQPDGSVKFDGQGKIVGGTNRYRRARGSFTFTGSSPAGGGVITLTFKGSMTY